MTLPAEVLDLVSAVHAQLTPRTRAHRPAPTPIKLEAISVAIVLGDHPSPPSENRARTNHEDAVERHLRAADLRTRAETTMSLWRPWGANVLLVDANATPALHGAEIVALRETTSPPCTPNSPHPAVHHGLLLGAAFATAIAETHPDVLVLAGGGFGYYRVASALVEWLHTHSPQSNLHDTATALPFACLADHCLLLLTGAVLACASANTPILVDGVAATVAATLACLLVPKVRDTILVAAASDATTQALIAWAQWQPILQQQIGSGESASAAIACATLRRQLADLESPG